MLITKQSQNKVVKLWKLNCPHCKTDLAFSKVQPVWCPSCYEATPPWRDLLDEVEERIYYHFNPNAWD